MVFSVWKSGKTKNQKLSCLIYPGVRMKTFEADPADVQRFWDRIHFMIRILQTSTEKT